jgi:hypothetical protein
MNDHICINIPFADQYVVCGQDGLYAFIDFDPLCMDIPLASRSVHELRWYVKRFRFISSLRVITYTLHGDGL